MTLAEVLVCLAVLAIVTAMIVSFAILMRQRVQASNTLLETQQDLSVLEATAEHWLERMTEAGASFSADGNTVTATVDDKTYALSFASGSLIGTLPGGEALTVHTEQIEALDFTAQTNASGDALFFCAVTCQADKPITFAINPRAGEIVGGAAS